MKAVVMAGGAGSRLRPLTVGRPKPMLPLANQGVLGHILTLLSQHGITDVVMTLQYMASMIEDYYGDGSSYGVRIRYVVEDTPLGTAGSVANARQYLDEPFIVISGDALTNFNLREIVRYHEERKAEATIVLYHVPDPLDYGVIVTDQEGRVVRFLEKPSWGEVASDTVNTGIYVLDPAVLDRIPANTSYDWASQVFPRMLQSGAPLYGYAAPGYWCDIGNFDEYRRATSDLLRGHVFDTSTFGKHIGGDVWVGREVDIAPDAQLFGPIYLGNEVQIKGGVVIRGPSVVRDYTIVDSRANIDRSIIWRNCYIGEDVELRGAIVSRQCSLRAKSALYEGVVVGDNSIIGEGAALHAGVKLWPGKEVDPGAVIKSSIIWGSQGRRVLFGRYGVTGVINVDLTPEFAARLGAAFGASLPRGSVVTINRDQHPGSRMLKRAVIAGLPSAGVNVQDLQTVPIPVARYYTAKTAAAGGVHVRISPFDQRVVDIRFFGSDGMNLSKHEERDIERVFFREDLRRAFMGGIGQISYASDVIPRYSAGFLAAVDQEAIRSAGFDIVVDYAFASTSQVLPEILQALAVTTTPLGARVDPAHISIEEEMFLSERRRLGVIVSALGSDLGVRLDVGGEKMFLVDHTGAQVPEPISCAAMVELALRSWPGSTVAAPVNQSSALEAIARRHGGRVVRTAVDQASIMHTASNADVVMAADGTGLFFFPRFQPVADGMMAVVMLLQWLAQQRTSLLDVVTDLPPVHTVSAAVHCAWDVKGAVMRRLQSQGNMGDMQVIDGVRLALGGERWVLIRPDPDRPIFHVTAEAENDEESAALLAEYRSLVEDLVQQRA